MSNFLECTQWVSNCYPTEHNELDYPRQSPPDNAVPAKQLLPNIEIWSVHCISESITYSQYLSLRLSVCGDITLKRRFTYKSKKISNVELGRGRDGCCKLGCEVCVCITVRNWASERRILIQFGFIILIYAKIIIEKGRSPPSALVLITRTSISK